MLAGGGSRRMGRDKAALEIPELFDGTLVERAVGMLRRCCDPVFVIAAAGQELPHVRARVLRDATPDLGPLAATGLGLAAAARAGAELAFVCAVDLPLLTPEFVSPLAALAVRSGAQVVLPWDGRDHYLAGVYRTGLADVIDTLVGAGQRRMSALVRVVDTRRVAVADSRPLTNLNAPRDIRELTGLRLGGR